LSIITRRCASRMFYCFSHIRLVLLCFTVHMIVWFVCFYFILNSMYSFVMFTYSYLYVCSFLGIEFYCVLFVCKCVPYCCHLLTTQLQLMNISYPIISCHVISFLQSVVQSSNTAKFSERWGHKFEPRHTLTPVTVTEL